MKILFIKERLAWPRSSGHDVHCYHLMRALGQAGHEVALASLHEPDPRAFEGAGLVSVHRIEDSVAVSLSETATLSHARSPGPMATALSGHACDQDMPTQSRGHGTRPMLTKSQERFRNYWGIPEGRIRDVGRLARDTEADAVVVVGLNVLPYLGAASTAKRVWYAGDEWVWHHLSQFSLWRRATWNNLKQALIKGMYERAYRSLLDRVWMVSPADRKALQWVIGSKDTDVIPNGIDSDEFAPGDEEVMPFSCVFWGRLDFGPNIQALEWFCRRVWPRIRKRVADASFSIYGFQPTGAVRRLAREDAGIRVIADLPDIRSEIRRHAVVVLPFISGGGIKNKLLEAAALGKAIVCTPRTVKDLGAGTAVVEASRSRRFAQKVIDLWNDGQRRLELGRAARQWVVERHTWEAAAQRAADGLRSSLGEVVST